MARSVKFDRILSCRFFAKIVAIGGDGAVPRWFSGEAADLAEGSAEAGFSTVTIPNVTLDTSEYKEGHFVWKEKQPGIATVAQASLQRGVFVGDGGLWQWLQALKDGGEYRVDIDVWVHQRNASAASMRLYPTNGVVVTLHDCFPNDMKALGDLDATSSEVSLSELSLEVERISMRHIRDGANVVEVDFS